MAIDSISRTGMDAAYQSSKVTPVEAVEPVVTSEHRSVGVKVTVAGKGGEDMGNSQQIEKDNERVKKAVEDINKKMNNTECQFGIHEKTGRVTIKIVDKETQETVREYPPEETLELIAKAWELAGIKVDKKL